MDEPASPSCFLFLTFLLSLHPPPAESCLCHGACGKQVAGGTIIPGLGMVLADERGSGTGATPLPAQPLQLSEVLQEGQDSLSDPSALRCRLGEWNRGTAQAGWNVGISSTSGGNKSLFFYFLITCGQSLFAGPASSQAALLALPQLALCCSLAACPLPWQCPLLLHALEYPDMLHQGMPRAGQVLFLRAGCRNPPFQPSS